MRKSQNKQRKGNKIAQDLGTKTGTRKSNKEVKLLEQKTKTGKANK